MSKRQERLRSLLTPDEISQVTAILKREYEGKAWAQAHKPESWTPDDMRFFTRTLNAAAESLGRLGGVQPDSGIGAEGMAVSALMHLTMKSHMPVEQTRERINKLLDEVGKAYTESQARYAKGEFDVFLETDEIQNAIERVYGEHPDKERDGHHVEKQPEPHIILPPDGKVH